MVRREASRVTTRVMHAMTQVRVMTGTVAVGVVLALDLVSSLGKHGNVTIAVVVVT